MWFFDGCGLSAAERLKDWWLDAEAQAAESGDRRDAGHGVGRG
jgi:hypothetical protein